MKKICCILLIGLICLLCVGCSDDNGSSISVDSTSSINNCNGINQWVEGSSCCTASPSSYYNYKEDCPNNYVPGYEIPATVNPNGCFTVYCR